MSNEKEKYIGSQQHFEDVINDYYEQKERHERELKKQYEKDMYDEMEREYYESINPNNHSTTTTTPR